MRNRAIDFVKGRRKDEAYPEASAETLVTSAAPYDSSHGIADDECLEFLRQEVNKLKREDRELFLMKARGLKEREIAEQTGGRRAQWPRRSPGSSRGSEQASESGDADGEFCKNTTAVAV